MKHKIVLNTKIAKTTMKSLFVLGISSYEIRTMVTFFYTKILNKTFNSKFYYIRLKIYA